MFDKQHNEIMAAAEEALAALAAEKDARGKDNETFIKATMEAKEKMQKYLGLVIKYRGEG